MDGIGAGSPRRIDEEVAAEVRVRRRDAGKVHGGVARPDVQRAGVGVAEHGDRADAEAPARAVDAAGDLTAVRNQRLSSDHIRKTP